MEAEIDNKGAAADCNMEESVSFDRVNAVAIEWMLDYMFVSLCRRFKEDNFDGFNDTLTAFQAISQSPSLKGHLHGEKMTIVAFLARVMHGKQLDVLFEEDDRVMPLMSAATIWSKLERTVADKSLFDNINILLLVQAVAVCLEKGQRSSASSALKWFESKHEFPQNLRVKLTTVVTQRETYHPFLMSFSFSRLLETIQSYLDAYLERNPSDYLLKEATKTAQSSQSTGSLEDEVTQASSLSEDNKSTEDTKKEKKTAACLRTKRKLLSTRITDVWSPVSCKTPVVSVSRLSENDISLLKSGTSIMSDTSKTQKTRKPPQKWTPELDKFLKEGVQIHGQGKWSRILMDYDFEGRTGTMLKDRWRVLIRAHQVG